MNVKTWRILRVCRVFLCLNGQHDIAWGLSGWCLCQWQSRTRKNDRKSARCWTEDRWFQSCEWYRLLQLGGASGARTAQMVYLHWLTITANQPTGVIHADSARFAGRSTATDSVGTACGWSGTCPPPGHLVDRSDERAGLTDRPGGPFRAWHGGSGKYRRPRDPVTVWGLAVFCGSANTGLHTPKSVVHDSTNRKQYKERSKQINHNVRQCYAAYTRIGHTTLWS